MGESAARQFIEALPRVDTAPFERRAVLLSIISFGLLATLLVYLVVGLFADPSLRTLGVLGLLALASIMAMYASTHYGERAKAAGLLNAYRDALETERKYVLLLRSISSKLLSETTLWVRAVERDEMKMIRGDQVPTGRKVQDFEYSPQSVDDVRDFLISATRGVQLVIIDGDAKSLSLDLLCVLSSDVQWRGVFEVLRDGAMLIAIVPEASSSLVEEIERIVNVSVLEKCVFLMPPSHTPSHEGGAGSWLKGMTRRDRWTESLARLPIAMPEYSEKGAILTFANTGTVSAHRPYTHDTLAEIVRERSGDGISLTQAMEVLNAKGLLTHTVVELQDRLRSLHPQ